MKDEVKKYSPEEISSSLNMFAVCHEKAERTIVNVLSLLPKEIVDFVADNIAIIAENEIECGSYWNFEHFYFKDKMGFLWLSADLWKKSKGEIIYTIVREVAHAYLGHNTFSGDAASREKEKVALCTMMKDDDADKLAIKWLSDEIDCRKLLKLMVDNC